MSRRHVLRVVDAHGGGNPTRLIVAGVPPLRGDTVAARQADFAARFDGLRTAVTTEPRGGNLTSSAVLVSPTHPDADVGVFFMEPFGYPAMCGSDTISVVTALIETGQIVTAGAEATVRLDTPAGLVTATATLSPEGVESVTFTNVPGFLCMADVRVDVPGCGTVELDVAYGGNFYALVSARMLGVDLEQDAPSAVGAVAGRVLAAAQQQIPVRHPVLGRPSVITHVLVHGSTAKEPAAGAFDARVQVVVPPNVLDRSPCGTGTTARVAALVHKGLLAVGDSLTHTSLTGESFVGRALEQVDLAGQPACRVAITGSAHVIGDGNIYIDERDPLAYGFSVA